MNARQRRTYRRHRVLVVKDQRNARARWLELAGSAAGRRTWALRYGALRHLMLARWPDMAEQPGGDV